jgi:hypothetical protein
MDKKLVFFSSTCEVNLDDASRSRSCGAQTYKSWRHANQIRYDAAGGRLIKCKAAGRGRIKAATATQSKSAVKARTNSRDWTGGEILHSSRLASEQEHKEVGKRQSEGRRGRRRIERWSGGRRGRRREGGEEGKVQAGAASKWESEAGKLERMKRSRGEGGGLAP